MVRSIVTRAIALLILTAPLSAQITIAGAVHDSAQQPVRRASVCASGPAASSIRSMVCATADSAGRYQMVVAPFLPLLLSVKCETTRPFPKQLAFDTITKNDAIVRRDWTVTTEGCDRRPMYHVVGRFRGYYSSGFEYSSFVPCPGDTAIIKTRGAWVTWSDALSRSAKWPAVKQDDDGNTRIYVEWSGTLVGPGHYGHMSASEFDFTPDRIFVMRAPSPRDCN